MITNVVSPSHAINRSYKVKSLFQLNKLPTYMKWWQIVVNEAWSGSDYVLSSQTEKLMAGTKFSDYLGLNHYKKAKKLKHFVHLRLANWPQRFAT